jgi:hypothetical protein
MIMRDLHTNARRFLGSIAVAGVGLVVSTPGWADDFDASRLKISGFLSIVDGRILSSSLDPNTYSGVASANGVNAPFYTADWSNAGVYDNKYSLSPESRAGIQATYSLTDNLKVVGQLVVRGTDGTPDLTWAYASYKLDKNWEVQLGRKRIPLYYYSDFQDIGVSYPWVTTPPELYGWDATNYNGASVRYSGSFGDTNVTASLFGGNESIAKSAYNKLFYSTDTKVDWNNIVGTDVEFNNGPATIRAVYVKADTHTVNVASEYNANAGLTAYGIAANLDFDSWFILSEVTTLKREFVEAQYSYTAPAFTVGVGVRLGKWTPFLNYARYTESSSELSQYSPQSYERTSATLRYDLTSSSALKAQLDHHKDVTNNFGGDATVFRVSYDLVF